MIGSKTLRRLGFYSLTEEWCKECKDGINLFYVQETNVLTAFKYDSDEPEFEISDINEILEKIENYL